MDEGLIDGGVSRREAEVLALVGEHLTHAEIGARLFISVRTVESHVASLRRKLGVDDRRSLIKLAVSLRRSAIERVAELNPSPLPTPLTSFVGRTSEREALVAMLGESRLVTVVGPGGVGKTRLAIAAASTIAGRFSDGACYVDLVPVTDPSLLATVVVTALGLPEPSGRTPEDDLVAALAGRQLLVVLDNCEHLIDHAAVLVEQILSSAPRLVVLVTSRIRMVVPFERVYQLPGLSLPTASDGNREDDGWGDAFALFVERAAAAGSPAALPGDRHQVAALCRALDGLALAIELAAARLPAVGWAALQQDLADPLGLLTGGSRLQSRHRSLKETLDWSYRLLDATEQAVLRRITVFSAPFDAAASATIAAFAPVEARNVTPALARLADHSLLVVVATPDGFRYRALETIRQYGRSQLEAKNEQQVWGRHLSWCLARATEIERAQGGERDHRQWQVEFDAIADDLRSALTWASRRRNHHRDAYHLAVVLARLLFLRGRPSESQRRYEQAAALTNDWSSAAWAFNQAAAVAKCRVVGDEALRLHRAAADAARRAGDLPATAVAWARAAELVNRFRGMFAIMPAAGTSETLLAEARSSAFRDPRAQAAILAAEANDVDPSDPGGRDVAEQAIGLAHAAHDPIIESAALDALTMIQITTGDIVGASETARRRVELVAALPLEPEAALELKDSLHVAVFTSLGAGDIPGARRWAETHLALPFLEHERHLANDELLVPDALAGDWTKSLTSAEEFLISWNQAGRPCAPGRGMGPSAVAMVHGLRGDHAARAEWLAIVAEIRGVGHLTAGSGSDYGEVFDALVALHYGRADDALRLLAPEPGVTKSWAGQLFCQWAAALRSEAAVLAGLPGLRELLTEAAVTAAHNPVAAAIVQRAMALMNGDRAALLLVAERLADAGSRYQAARTLSFAAGDAGDAGRAQLSAMGAAPTAN